MARAVFYPTRDQLVTDPFGSPVAGQQVKIYTAQTGGTQITDLLYVNPTTGALGSAVPSGVLTSDGNGFIPAFASVDGGRDVVYADCGPYGSRTALLADPGSTAGGAVASVDGQTGAVTLGAFYGPANGSNAWLIAAGANPDLMFTGTITRNSDGAPTSAGVLWPDGTAGIYTGTAATGVAAGAIDSYTVTYVGGTTKTLTQAAVTRNASGDVTNIPTLTVS